MAVYIGVKKVNAERAIRKGGKVYLEGEAVPKTMDAVETGYKVIYPDGYVSWCPKDTFEKANRLLLNDSKITQEDVDDFIVRIVTMQIDEKTTIVKATLANGFVLVESSSCVDPKNFDINLGKDICMNKIEDKVWFLLGFLLQCTNGLNQK